MLSNVHSRIKSTALFLGLRRPDRRRYDRHAASRIMQLQRTLDVLLEAVLPQVVRLVRDDILGPVVVIVLALPLELLRLREDVRGVDVGRMEPRRRADGHLEPLRRCERVEQGLVGRHLEAAAVAGRFAIYPVRAKT